MALAGGIKKRPVEAGRPRNLKFLVAVGTTSFPELQVDSAAADCSAPEVALASLP